MDEYGGSYRCHTLLRDFLQRELAMREPELVTTLHRRAAAWYQANDAIEPAVDHAFAAGDLDLVATLVGNGFGILPLVRPSSDDPCLGQASRRRCLEAHPWLAVLAAWEEIAAGDVAATVRFADVAERGSVRGPAARRHRVLRGRALDAPSRHGPPGRRRRAGERQPSGRARRGLGSWRDFALWQLAFARLTVGDLAGADAALADARSSPLDRPATSRSGTACSGIALWWPSNEAPGMPPLPSIEESDAIDPAPQIDGYLSSVPSRVVRIRLMIHGGEIAAARRELARATGLRPLLTAAAPAGAVQLLLAFARAHVAIDDPAGARALIAQASDVIRDRPDLGVLPAEVDALRASLAARTPGRGGGATSLTVAELRVLSLLPYYLSFKEIGQRLGVKETTIKSQALAIYRKLGAATRSDAVDLAVEAGLLEPFLAGRLARPSHRRLPGLTTGQYGVCPPMEDVPVAGNRQEAQAPRPTAGRSRRPIDSSSPTRPRVDFEVRSASWSPVASPEQIRRRRVQRDSADERGEGQRARCQRRRPRSRSGSLCPK